MERYSVRGIKALINSGEAEDLQAHYTGNASEYAAYLAEIGPLSQIGYSCGTYGCSGAVLRSIPTGKLYAIAGRTSCLFATV